MKKFLLVVAACAGVWWYASHRFDFADVMTYARKNPSAGWAPAAEYSVALVYYQRADYPKAQAAFTQLLTDYPTGQYEARALLRLSETAEQNNDIPAARLAVDQYLTDFPEGPDRVLVQRRKELLYNR
jgi:outer membrane protein assembly factor BamD (BamD/ComL family)